MEGLVDVHAFFSLFLCPLPRLCHFMPSWVCMFSRFFLFPPMSQYDKQTNNQFNSMNLLECSYQILFLLVVWCYRCQCLLSEFASSASPWLASLAIKFKSSEVWSSNQDFSASYSEIPSSQNPASALQAAILCTYRVVKHS